MRKIGLAMLCLLAFTGYLWAQGAGPIGRPGTGGSLPQDFDTITKGLATVATQTQAAATQCQTTICVVATNATDANGIKLRQCTVEPMRQKVVNTTAHTLTVYGAGTDTINGVTTTTGVSQAATSAVEYVCVLGGTAAQWRH